MTDNLKVSDEILAKARLIQTKANFLVTDLFSGEYTSAFRGSGIEFEEVREYHEGDDVRNIDWKVSARAQKTYVKVYKDERELTIFFVVDVSGSSLFGPAGKTKEEVTAEIAALLCYAAQKNNDKVGLVIFSDFVEHYIPPGKGKGHIWKIIRDILSFIPKNRGTNVAKALEFVSKVRKRRSVVFLISDFITGEYERNFGALTSRHEVIAVQVSDAMESHFPKIGYVNLRDLETNEEIVINSGNREVRSEIERQHNLSKQSVKNICKKYQSGYIHVSSTDNYLEKMVNFFASQGQVRIKKR